MLNETLKRIPPHLRRYVVEQDVTQYTYIDHAVWRYIMKQLTNFLSKHAYECYMEGLEKTGIGIEEIPSIETIDENLKKFGWSAVPVSGFIPPAAFMELQSLGILPIASDMRSMEHLNYTPAPDIVHEAAGHAPILIDPEFSDYLHQYASVASKSILNKEDLDLYEAIRILSDLKENPISTALEIKKAEKHLEKVAKSIKNNSEAAQLARMNWWTAEYGLIGDPKNPKIYGAGLLSSAGESQSCLGKKVKKIPMSLKCIQYSYDITEPQPQLFVTPSFEHLKKVLKQFEATMAFRTGGAKGLDKIKKAKTVNTIELNSGLQISGVLKNYVCDPKKKSVHYVQLEGACQLSYKNIQLEGHGRDYHAQGYGTPIGLLKKEKLCLSSWTPHDFSKKGIVQGKDAVLEFVSGVVVKGKVKSFVFKDGKCLLIAFENCKVTHKRKTYFDPEWGVFDLALGSAVPSVYGGPADRGAFGESQDFINARVKKVHLSDSQLRLNDLYGRVRNIRQKFRKSQQEIAELKSILSQVEKEFPRDWLLKHEINEILNPANIRNRSSAENGSLQTR